MKNKIKERWKKTKDKKRDGGRKIKIEMKEIWKMKWKGGERNTKHKVKEKWRIKRKIK